MLSPSARPSRVYARYTGAKPIAHEVGTRLFSSGEGGGSSTSCTGEYAGAGRMPNLASAAGA